MATCAVCSSYFLGRGRKKRCDGCESSCICVSCNRRDATAPGNATCTECHNRDKTCRDCGAVFRGVKGQCNRCRYAQNAAERAIAAKKWREATGQNEKLRRQHMWAKYRLTWDDYVAMLERQGGGCAICRCTEPGGRGRWHVDHDHRCCPGIYTCGKCIRGLLCNRCNLTLGSAADEPHRLRSAAAYLEARAWPRDS